MVARSRSLAGADVLSALQSAKASSTVFPPSSTTASRQGSNESTMNASPSRRACRLEKRERLVFVSNDLDVVHDPGPWIRVRVLVDTRIEIAAQQAESRHVPQVSCERIARTPSASNIGLSLEMRTSRLVLPVNRSNTSGATKVARTASTERHSSASSARMSYSPSAPAVFGYSLPSMPNTRELGSAP